LSDRTRWNKRYRSGYGANEPNPRLSRYFGFLRPGLALDLAGGLGQNARLLNGWTTIVADVSDEALARASGLLVLVESPVLPFAPGTFDTIVCTYFLDPEVDFSSLLKPGGTLFFETFTRAHAKYRPEMSPAYLLDPSAVSTFFRDLKTVLWEEQDDGTRVYGTFIGVK
jgi:SAM-dependent methyltransferase